MSWPPVWPQNQSTFGNVAPLLDYSSVSTSVSTTAAPPTTAVITSNQMASSFGLNTVSANSVDAYQQMTPEQQYVIQQQNWQQWQIYQHQYAQWQAQYGEQYQREIQARMTNQLIPQNMNMPPLPPEHGIINTNPPPPPPPQEKNANLAEFPQSNQYFSTSTNIQKEFNKQYSSQSQRSNQKTSHQFSIATTPIQSQVLSQQLFNTQQPAQQSHATEQILPKSQPYNSQFRDTNNFSSNNSSQSINNLQSNNNNIKINSNNVYDNRICNTTDDSVGRFGQNNRNNYNNRNNNHRNSFSNDNNRFGRDLSIWNKSDPNENQFRENNSNNTSNIQSNRIEHSHFASEQNINTIRDKTDLNDVEDGKTPEEIVFDAQFCKWEEQFMNWKRDNANHPDRKAYNDYEKKMEECRAKLVARREEIRRNRSRCHNQSNDCQENIKQNVGLERQILSQPSEKSDTFELNKNNENLQVHNVENSTETKIQDGKIPGLDLISNSIAVHANASVAQQYKADLSAIKSVLDNPNLTSLLSTIQVQQNYGHTAQQTSTDLQQKQQQSFEKLNQSENSIENDNHNDNDNNLNSDVNNPFRRFDNSNNLNRDSFNKSTNNLPNAEISAIQAKTDTNFRSLLDIEIENPYDLQGEKHQESYQRGNSGQQLQSESENDVDGGSAGGQRNRRNSRNRNKRRARQQQKLQLQPIYENQYMNNISFDSIPNDSSKRPRLSQSNLLPNRYEENENKEFSEDFYRPVKIIDYQNQSKPSLLSQANDNDRDDFFPRKIIDYYHKSRVHIPQTFCPVQRIDYNHTLKAVQNEQLKQNKVNEQRCNRFDNFQSVTLGNLPSSKNKNATDRLEIKSIEEKPIKSNVIQNNEIKAISIHTKSKQSNAAIERSVKDMINITDLLYMPKRKSRPKKIVILMRGPPGSGKSYLAKLIKDKEAEMGGSVRILSINDYFTTEMDEDKILPNGKKITSKQIKYEFDANMEDTYMQYMLKSFKKTIIDGLFNIVIVDCDHISLFYYMEFYNFSKTYTFTPMTCEMPLDLQQCLKNNIHNREECDIIAAINNWVQIPSHYLQLNYQPLLDDVKATKTNEEHIGDNRKNFPDLDAISDEELDKNTINLDPDDENDGNVVNEFGFLKCKWDFDNAENKLARLDGINKPIKHATIEDYLQMDGWEPPPSSSNGKKRVRWADIEEKRERDKQRAIGFVVGQTNWNDLMDQHNLQRHNSGSSALAKIKYI